MSALSNWTTSKFFIALGVLVPWLCGLVNLVIGISEDALLLLYELFMLVECKCASIE